MIENKGRLRVLLVYPTFDLEMNELAMAWKVAVERSSLDVRVICSSGDVLKGGRNALKVEQHERLDIRRFEQDVTRGLADDATMAWAQEWRPEVIVCGFPCATLGHALRRLTGARFVLHTENWFDDRVLPRKLYLGLKPIRPLSGWVRREWLSRSTDAVMIADPVEGQAHCRPGSKHVFVPWPHPGPKGDAAPVPFPLRDRSEVIYIGSIASWKGADRLGQYLSFLLEHDPQSRVTVVGPLIDKAARRAVEQLRRWPQRFEHVTHLPRAAALDRMSRALCVFGPSELRGWGQIGDAFGTGTPFVALSAFYELQAGTNAVVVGSPEAFVKEVLNLRADEAHWSRLASAGKTCMLQRHSLPHVADAFLTVLKGVSP